MRPHLLVAWCLLALLPARGDASEPGPPAGGVPVAIATADGLTIAGTWWSGGADDGPAVVLLHMYGSERSAWRPLVRPLLERRVGVLAIDLRGHGESRVQNEIDLGPMVEERSPRLFASMHDDASAAVRWLAESGRDPKRIGLVGASVGCSVALHASALHPESVAAVLCLAPGRKYLGIDSLAHAADLAPSLPLMLVAHRDERGGVDELAEAARAARQEAEAPGAVGVRVLENEYPPGMGHDRSFFHGTATFGRVPLIEEWVAGYMARELGGVQGDALLDGEVGVEFEPGRAWDRAGVIASPEGGQLRAYRVGRRLVFGGRAPAGAQAIELLVEARLGEQGLATLRIRLAPAGDELELDGPGVLGGMIAGALMPAELAWEEPPARVLFVRRESALTFEGEASLPLEGEGEPTLRVAWGLPEGESLRWAEAVKADDPATWSEVPAR